MLTAERNHDITRYKGGSPRAPVKKNQEGQWDFWEGRIIEKVLDAARAGRSLAHVAPLSVRESRIAQPVFISRRSRVTPTPAPRHTLLHRARTPPPTPHVVKEEERYDPDLK